MQRAPASGEIFTDPLRPVDVTTRPTKSSAQALGSAGAQGTPLSSSSEPPIGLILGVGAGAVAAAILIGKLGSR